MLASLDAPLLLEHLARAGSRTLAEPLLPPAAAAAAAWPLSCLLARECALAGAWTGTGLSRPGGGMVAACAVDFRSWDAGPHGGAPRSPAPIHATSPCGRFYAVARGRGIHAYEVDGRSVRLVSRTRCEDGVEAVAVGVTGGGAGAGAAPRLVVAALLRGRVGVYVDVPRGGAHPFPLEAAAGGGTRVAAERAPVLDLLASSRATADGGGAGPSPGLHPVVVRDVPVGDFDELSANAASLGSRELVVHTTDAAEAAGPAEATLRADSSGRRRRLRRRGMRRMPTAGAAQATDTDADACVVVYRHVCSADDPAVSVAISPARRCVAFGARGGVELYWVGRAGDFLVLGTAYGARLMHAARRSTPAPAATSTAGSRSWAPGPPATCTSSRRGAEATPRACGSSAARRTRCAETATATPRTRHRARRRRRAARPCAAFGAV